MTNEECFSVLGVSPGATQDEIKKAFKRQAQIHHPDKGGKQEDFVRLNEAYNILSGKQKPQVQDMPGINLDDLFGGRGFGFPFDPFRSWSGANTQPQYPEHDKDVQINFSITAEDVRKGRTMKVNFQKAKKCEKCNGIGGKEKQQCPTCGGEGQLRSHRSSGNTFFVNTSPCYDCGMTGSKIIDICKTCEGNCIVVFNDHMIIEIKEKK